MPFAMNLLLEYLGKVEMKTVFYSHFLFSTILFACTSSG